MSTRHGGQGGVIVNVSSRAVTLGMPGEYVHYAASKAAVNGLTKGLALEVAAEGIRVGEPRPHRYGTPAARALCPHRADDADAAGWHR